MSGFLFKKIIIAVIATVICSGLAARVGSTAGGFNPPPVAWRSPVAGDKEFNSPGGVAIDDSGNIYVTDTYNNRIQKFSPDGTFITKWGNSGTGDGQFNGPLGIAIDGSGNLYVADVFNNRIQKFDSGRQFLAKWDAAGSGEGTLRFLGLSGPSS